MKQRAIALFLASAMAFGTVLPAAPVYAAEVMENAAAEGDAEQNSDVEREVAETEEQADPEEMTEPKAEEVPDIEGTTEPEEENEVSDTVEDTEPEEENEASDTVEDTEPEEENGVSDTGTEEDKKTDVGNTTEAEEISDEENPAESASEDEEQEDTDELMLYANGASGSCGASLNWSYVNGTLTISGTGAMNEYPVYDTPASPQCMPWYYYRDSITALNIEEGVTSIGTCAFWGCKNLTSVTTPSSLRSIGFAAFADCTGIQQINIPSGNIGESAFIRCSGLKRATIGRGVKAIGISAFENCSGMEAVYINDVAAWCAIDFGGYLANPLQLAKHLYLNGALVKDLNIPAGVPAISDYAFEYCEDLTSITVPSSVTRIGEYAFYYCKKLESASLQNGLAEIGASAFDSSSLKNVSIPGSVSSIGSYAFAWTPVSTVNIQRGTIESYAFLGCGNIGDVTIGHEVSYIGEGAFDKCAGLRTVHYSGSKSQWNAISKGAKNEPLTGAEIICSGTGSADRPSNSTEGVCAGATVTFGKYEQDNNVGNGKEAIEWTVLDVKGDQALVISKKILDFRRYYPNEQTAVTWENSTLRAWLNREFMSEAFTDSERSDISATNLTNDSNSVYGTPGGVDTTDYIFVLSASEAEQYFKIGELRMAACTAYASNSGSDPALVHPVLGTSYWWLRTPGMYTYDAMYTHYTGSLRRDGMAVANTIVGVRPAMWVDADALTVLSAPGGNQNNNNSKIEQFVTRLYNVCLNRDPDEDGKADWTERLINGKETGTTVAHGFVFSQEFKNRNFCNEDYVKQLYRAFMGREYDAGGLSDWVDHLETGMTREEVFNGFAQSAEFGNICTEYGIILGTGIEVPVYGTVPKGKCEICGATDGVTAFVTRLYNICLDRAPETAGLNDWTGFLWKHTKSGKDVASGFIFSEEFTNKGLSDEDYVEYLYKAFFDRAADTDGKGDWLNRMHSQGYSRSDVFNGFVGSEEFDNLCKKYGITRDTV